MVAPVMSIERKVSQQRRIREFLYDGKLGASFNAAGDCEPLIDYALHHSRGLITIKTYTTRIWTLLNEDIAWSHALAFQFYVRGTKAGIGHVAVDEGLYVVRFSFDRLWLARAVSRWLGIHRIEKVGPYGTKVFWKFGSAQSGAPEGWRP